VRRSTIRKSIFDVIDRHCGPGSPYKTTGLLPYRNEERAKAKLEKLSLHLSASDRNRSHRELRRRSSGVGGGELSTMGSLKSEEELERIDDEAVASKEAILYVNGSRKVLPDGLAHLTLLEYLRGTVGGGLECRSSLGNALT